MTKEFVLKLTNRFEALTENKTEDPKALVSILKSTFGIDVSPQAPEVLARVTKEGAPVEEAEGEFDDWESELRRKLHRSKKRKEMHFKWGDHCSKAFECPYEHSKDESSF